MLLIIVSEIIIAGILILLVIRYLLNKVTLSLNCPSCRKSLHTRRVKRGPFTKYVFYLLFIKKLHCSKCWREYYQLFGLFKPDPETANQEELSN